MVVQYELDGPYPLPDTFYILDPISVSSLNQNIDFSAAVLHKAPKGNGFFVSVYDGIADGMIEGFWTIISPPRTFGIKQIVEQLWILSINGTTINETIINYDHL